LLRACDVPREALMVPYHHDGGSHTRGELFMASSKGVTCLENLLHLIGDSPV